MTAYIPPNRRYTQGPFRAGSGSGSLDIKWTPRFDLSKQAAAFPSLGGQQRAPTQPEPARDTGGPTLGTFLDKAAQRTERIRRRGRPTRRRKCPIGWVKLPLAPRGPEPLAPPRPSDYQRAAARMISRIQARRDLENEILGPHSGWIDAPRVWDQLTHADDSEIDYYSGEESLSGSEDEG